jgi:hypothetical protein
MNIENLSDSELIEVYFSSLREMKSREIIRTKNVVGEIGERLVIDHFNNNPNLPNLMAAEVGTQNVDAFSKKGERYSIKSISRDTTGVFYGLEPPGSEIPDEKVFEYLIICKFDQDYVLKNIYQLDWQMFVKHKHWHSRMSAWNIVMSKKLIDDSKKIM